MKGPYGNSKSFVIKRAPPLVEDMDEPESLPGHSSASASTSGSNKGLGYKTAAAARSFVRKRHTREQLGSKFPDSERGEARLRASFLEEYRETTAPAGPAMPTFGKKVEAVSTSPTSREKTFFKTPRYNLGNTGNPLEAEKVAREMEEQKVASQDNDGGNGKKLSGFFSTVFSKHRNRK